MIIVRHLLNRLLLSSVVIKFQTFYRNNLIYMFFYYYDDSSKTKTFYNFNDNYYRNNRINTWILTYAYLSGTRTELKNLILKI